MKKVVILRGPSGAGKSTYTKEALPEDASIVSADHFFMKTDDEGAEYYDFNPMKLGEAHAACQTQFVHKIQAGAECIVVDNTHIHHWEYQTYKSIAELAGYEVEIVEFVAETVEDIRTCIARNAHGVPADIVARMCINFEPDEDAKYRIGIV
jgi:predicted kinase